ncbi:MAG: hypothetical protein WCP74_12510 [Sphingobacteriia bacterium]
MSIKAQILNVKDLELLLIFNNEKIDTYLSNKGFLFESIKELDDCGQIEYKYNIPMLQREYFSKFNYFNGKKLITYCIFDVKAYSSIKQQITNSGFVFIEQYNYQGKLVLKYKKGDIYLSIWSGKDEADIYNIYEINLSNKE